MLEIEIEMYHVAFTVIKMHAPILIAMPLCAAHCAYGK